MKGEMMIVMAPSGAREQPPQALHSTLLSLLSFPPCLLRPPLASHWLLGCCSLPVGWRQQRLWVFGCPTLTESLNLSAAADLGAPAENMRLCELCLWTCWAAALCSAAPKPHGHAQQHAGLETSPAGGRRLSAGTTTAAPRGSGGKLGDRRRAAPRG